MKINYTFNCLSLKYMGIPSDVMFFGSRVSYNSFQCCSYCMCTLLIMLEVVVWSSPVFRYLSIQLSHQQQFKQCNLCAIFRAFTFAT